VKSVDSGAPRESTTVAVTVAGAVILYSTVVVS
jgi:hypothetical protein